MVSTLLKKVYPVYAQKAPNIEWFGMLYGQAAPSELGSRDRLQIPKTCRDAFGNSWHWGTSQIEVVIETVEVGRLRVYAKTVFDLATGSHIGRKGPEPEFSEILNQARIRNTVIDKNHRLVLDEISVLDMAFPSEAERKVAIVVPSSRWIEVWSYDYYRDALAKARDEAAIVSSLVVDAPVSDNDSQKSARSSRDTSALGSG
jgi:DNA-binding transcriptional regulator/RsmH inhibitor MraZ